MLAGAPRIDFGTAADGYRFAVRIWDVDRPIGRVVFVHGIISHGGWYLRVCRHLAAANLEVHFLDRRGSGLNLPARGDVDHWQTWIDDVATYLHGLGESMPTTLVGVSWGGKLAAAFARRHPELIQAFGMLCPGLFARQMPGLVQRGALRAMAACGLASQRVTIPLRDPALFTESPRWQKYVGEDPFTLRQVTVRFALADRQLTRYAIAAPGAITRPALLLLAGRDRIVANPRVRAYFGKLRSADKQLREYPHAAHTLEFEPDPEPYFRDLTDWLISAARSPR